MTGEHVAVGHVRVERQQHREAVSAEPGDAGQRSIGETARVEQLIPRQPRAGAERGHEPITEAAQRLVALLGAERIVDRLEAVDVDQDQDGRIDAALGIVLARQAPVEQLHEEQPVRQLGQRVDVTHALLPGARGERVPHAQRELARIDRLGEEIRRARLQRAQLGRGVVGPREHDHGNAPQLVVEAHLVEDVEAGHPPA